MFFQNIDGKKIYSNLLKGKWEIKNNDNIIEIKSPINGETVGFVEAMSKEAVDEAINVAKETQLSWRDVPTNEKSKLLHNVADLLEERIEEMADVMVIEIGKDRRSCMSEIKRTADLIRFTADTAENIKGESIPGDSFPGFKNDKISIVTREPLGVVLAISPFNYPVNLAASKIAPALMAGNTVVFKPATQGSICGLYLAKAFNEAGIPSGVLNTITGKGSEIGDYVVTHKDIDFVNFTGSSEVGKRISRITEMKPLLMELGGKDAAIVLEDADLTLAAKNIVSGAFSYSGQRCTAVKRVLVLDTIADKLVEEIAAEIKDKNDMFYLGRGLDYALAMEGSLKIKEISYMHAEAFAAGELKHGTIALIEEGTPVLVIATQEQLFEKMLSNMQEVKARGAKVIAIAKEHNKEVEKSADRVIYIPEVEDMFASITAVVPMQLLSYHVAKMRGCDIDKPRNLAKSVTVE